MKTTERLGLALPEGSDFVNIETLNENFRKLDAHGHGDAYSEKNHSHTPASIGAAVTATYNVPVTASSWTKSGDYYYMWIDVEGILPTDNPIPGVAYGTDNDANVAYDECFAKVLHITTSSDQIQVWATEAISTAFPIQLKVVR